MDHVQCFLFILYENEIDVLKKLQKPYHGSIVKGYALLPKYLMTHYYNASDFFSENKVTVLKKGKCYPSLLTAIQQQKCEVMEIVLKETGGGLRHTGNKLILHAFGEKENKEVFKQLFPRETVYHSAKDPRSRLRPVKYVSDEKENITILEQILANGADISYRHSNGGTFLHLAFIRHDETLASLLLRCGANVDAQDSRGETCLHATIVGQFYTDIDFRQNSLSFPRMADALLHYNVNVNIGNNKGSTALHKAIEKNNSEMFELILKKGSPNLEVTDNFGYAALHKASVRGRKKMVENLLQHGANIDSLATDSVTNKFKNATPLHFATRAGRYEVMKILLENGADVNAVGFNESSVLRLAVALDNLDVRDSLGYEGTNLFRYVDGVYGRVPEFVKLVLDHQPSLDSKFNKEAFCYVMAARNESSVRCLGMLIEYGFKIDAEMVDSSLLLHGAVSRNNFEFVEKLLAMGADVNFPFRHCDFENKYYCSRLNDQPLHTAVCFDKDKMVALLLNKGADVNGKCAKGKTPLMYAIDNGLLTIVDTLLKSGADIHIADKNGITALHLASAKGFCEVVQHLVQNNVDVNVLCSQKRSPIFHSVKGGHESVTNLLLKHDALINLKDESGNVLLHTVTSPSVVELLVRNGLDVNIVNACGETPLFLAVKCSNLNVIKILMKFGARVDIRNKIGDTPLYAIYESSVSDFKKSIIDERIKMFSFLLEYDFKNIDLAHEMNQIEEPAPSDSSDAYYDEYSDNEFTFNKIAVVTVRHIVKLTALGITVSEGEFEAFPNFHDIMASNFPHECEAEVDLMKNETVGSSDVTFYDIVTKGSFHNSRYARNQSVVQVAESEAYESLFPIYAGMVKCQFLKGVQRRELLDQGLKIFHLTFCEFTHLPFDIREKIVDYLTNQEIAFVICASTHSV